MAESFNIKIDLEKVRDNLFVAERTPWTIDGVKEWLRSERFIEQSDNTWLCEEIQLDLLDPSEVLSAEPF